jgi:dipeptidase D
LANKYEFDLRIIADKPFFPYKDKSIIRNILSKTYEELYGKKTTINKVHACMEGGILSNNIKDLDICVIAPTIENCHSINERVSISSTKRVYEWLKQSLIKYNIS